MCINKINGTENLYSKPNKNISFKSKFFPNEVLKDAFLTARVCTKYATRDCTVEKSRYFTKIIDYCLNDGKDDLIKLTRGPKGSTMRINGKKVNYYKEKSPSYFVDGQRVIDNVVDYFTKKEAVEVDKLSDDEYKSIKVAIDTLKSDLNADDASKNPNIRSNLIANVENVNRALRNNTLKHLEELKSKIFNK